MAGPQSSKRSRGEPLEWRDDDAGHLSEEQLEELRLHLEAAKEQMDLLLDQTRADSVAPDLDLPIGRLSRIDAIQMQAIDIDPKKIGRRFDGLPVLEPDWLDGSRTLVSHHGTSRGGGRPFVLGYVTSHGAREQISGRLDASGYRLGRDYLHVG